MPNYRENRRAFIEREDAKKLEKKATQKDSVESTSYTKRKKIGPYWLLCTPVDHPEVWAPSSGKKSYELDIEGELFEFKHEMPGKQFEHLNTESDLTPPATPGQDTPAVDPSTPSDSVSASITPKLATLDKSSVLKKIQFILEQSQVQPNRILRSIQTLRTVLESSSKPSVMIDRVKSALHYEGIETWVVEKVIGELKAGLEGSPTSQPLDMSHLIEDTTALKAKIENYKPIFAKNKEKSKALDDATSACDLVVHHILDIMEGNIKEPLMAKLRFHANPVNINTAEEIQAGDVLSFGDKALLKVINIFVDMKENLVKVKWTEKHAEGVNTHEESLPTFKQRILTLKRIYNASLNLTAKKPEFSYTCEKCGGKFESFEKLQGVKRICDDCEDDHTASSQQVKKVVSTSEAAALAQGTTWDIANATNAAEYIRLYKALYFLMEGDRAVACGYMHEGVLNAFDTQDKPLDPQSLEQFKSLIR